MERPYLERPYLERPYLERPYLEQPYLMKSLTSCSRSNSFSSDSPDSPNSSESFNPSNSYTYLHSPKSVNSLRSISLAISKSSIPDHEKNSSIKFYLKKNNTQKIYCLGDLCNLCDLCGKKCISYSSLYEKINSMKNVSDINKIFSKLENIDIDIIDDYVYDKYQELVSLALHKKTQILRFEVMGDNMYFDE
jgi:hypothetical protein